jgi:PTS system mannose-specific IIA component
MSDHRIGYLIIAHGVLAYELLQSLEFIAGKQDNFRSIAIDHGLEIDAARQLVKEGVEEVMGGDGVIVLTDLFGGSPSNIAMSLIDDYDMEIVAGVNMPLLVHAATASDGGQSLHDMATELQAYGRSNIFVASDVLNGHVGSSATNGKKGV